MRLRSGTNEMSEMPPRVHRKNLGQPQSLVRPWYGPWLRPKMGLFLVILGRFCQSWDVFGTSSGISGHFPVLSGHLPMILGRFRGADWDIANRSWDTVSGVWDAVEILRDTRFLLWAGARYWDLDGT